MGQIVSDKAKPKRCNLNQLSQVPTPAAGEHILVSSDNSMNAAGQGNFDCYIVGDGNKAAAALELQSIRGDVSAGDVYINDTPLDSFFYAYQHYNAEDILTTSGKYVYGDVGSTIRESFYTTLQYGRIPITYGDVFSLTATGFSQAKGFVITDSDLKILEVSSVEVSVVNYKVTHSTAAYLYVNNLTNFLSSFSLSKRYVSSALDNDYSGGESRIPSAESVKKIHDAIGSDTKSITVHIEQSGKASSFYTDYYPLPYYADATSAITINNVSITSSGNAQIEFSNGNREDRQEVLIRTGNTYSVTLNKRCSVISIWSNADFSCDVNITFKVNSWIKPFPCYGLKVATLGDSITAISNCNIGQLMTAYLHAHLINNFAVGSAYAADLPNTEIDFTFTQGAYTPNNVLSNQVRRLLRWTTPEGEQITWTHPIDGEFSIDTSIGTGLGNTDDIPDIIYIAIGINDASEKIDTDLDAIVNASYSDLTRLTMGSAYRWAIETLQSAYPNAMILLASPLFTSSRALDRIKRGDVVKYVCASVGVNYIPSREDSGYTNLIADDNGQLHPNRAWSNKIAKFVAKNIEDKYVNSWRYDDSQSN